MVAAQNGLGALILVGEGLGQSRAGSVSQCMVSISAMVLMPISGQQRLERALLPPGAPTCAPELDPDLREEDADNVISHSLHPRHIAKSFSVRQERECRLAIRLRDVSLDVARAPSSCAFSARPMRQVDVAEHVRRFHGAVAGRI